MGVEMIYANPDYHIPESDGKIYIEKIEVSNGKLLIDLKKDTKDYDPSLGDERDAKFEDLFPANGGVSDHYIPYTILS